MKFNLTGESMEGVHMEFLPKHVYMNFKNL